MSGINREDSNLQNRNGSLYMKWFIILYTCPLDTLCAECFAHMLCMFEEMPDFTLKQRIYKSVKYMLFNTVKLWLSLA
jgi:hypothetical protein